jgi:hypothetical protein
MMTQNAIANYATFMEAFCMHNSYNSKIWFSLDRDG